MGISQEILKLIACVSMLIDHIGYTFLPYPVLRIIGRLAYPIYAFLLCQGLQHTKNPGKYLLRMFLILLLSELPYDILFFGYITPDSQNVMFTLMAGLMMGLCIQNIKPFMGKLLITIPFALLADVLCSDYGSYGIWIIALFMFSRYASHPRLVEALGLFLLALCNNQFTVAIAGIAIPIQLFTVFAVIPIALYNGKKAATAPALQWGFYLFYPVHLVVLFLFKVILSSIC